MMKKSWIDISQPLSNELAHWPGDTPFTYETAFTKEQTGSVNIGRITTSLHTGTHVDAPFHFHEKGEKMSGVDIEVFIGPARVVDVSAYEVVTAEALHKLGLAHTERLLLKTAVPNNPGLFPEKVPVLEAGLADYLGSIGVRLLGVDVPSVDPLDSKEMEMHHALYRNGIHILENIMLDDVEEGNYELIALPLPIKDGDGSPVRAVIRPI